MSRPSSDIRPVELVTASITTGLVQGIADRSVLAFKGIPYGRSTGGEGRFRPPAPAEPWTGVRSALLPGPSSPQITAAQLLIDRPETQEQFLFYRDKGAVSQSEDCLRVNVWTPDLSRGRPVMVYFHGGGLSFGSGSELLAYDGANLAGSEDVVVVTFNHRLNLLGFLDLSSFPEFEDSANLGLQDAVLLLQWVRENIAVFGGDPGNVTIFGQSGGGVKVASLLSMPSAAGLFHRAIIQSGSFSDSATPDEARHQAESVLQRLSVGPASLGSLPLETLMEVAGSLDISAFRPSFDGNVITEPLLGAPNALGAEALSARIPLIVGNCQNEFVSMLASPEAGSMTTAELESRIRQDHGSTAPELLRAVADLLPEESPFGLYAAIGARTLREGVVRQLEAKTTQGGTAWSYMFTWKTPVLDGQLGTFHSAEVAFAFKNAGLCRRQTGGTAAALQLQEEIGGAWAAFARDGDPSRGHGSAWRPWADGRPTMLFDSPVSCIDGWDDAVLRASRDPS